MLMRFPPRFAIIRNAIKVLRTWGRVQAGPKRKFAISLKMRKRNLFTTHLNVGLRYTPDSVGDSR